MAKHTYIVYPMRGADITIKAENFRMCYGYSLTDFIDAKDITIASTIDFYNIDETKDIEIVATFNLNNITGFERVD